MNGYLKKSIIKVLNIQYEDNGTKHELLIDDNERYKLCIYIEKVSDGKYSFGYVMRVASTTRELKCGINVFSGNLERLLLGFIKSLLNIKLIERNIYAKRYLLDIVEYLSNCTMPITEDESKVNVEQWEPPIIFTKNYLS